VSDDLESVFRREAGPCTATLIRVLGDIDRAEDAVAEAFAIAAARWPLTGVPANPGGWITTTARNRAIDRIRRERTRTERHLAAHRLHLTNMAGLPRARGDRRPADRAGQTQAA
jgi:RNA polymerase sigma-70 factor (ECF subfamily)